MRNPPLTDDELVGLFFSRSERAIDETDRKYGRYLTKIAENFVHDRGAAVDCKNEALLAVWERVPPETPASLPAFLVRILRNRAIRRYEKDKRGAKEFETALDELADLFTTELTAEDELIGKELSALIGRFAAGLSERRRFIFVSRFYLGKKIREIAAKLGISETAVYAALAEMKEDLKKTLVKEGYAI